MLPAALWLVYALPAYVLWTLLFPLRYGTGQSNKVLEAAEGGCAIVATPKAMRGLDALSKHALIAADAHELARMASDAISDESRRTAGAKALRAIVETTDTLFAVASRGRERGAARSSRPPPP